VEELMAKRAELKNKISKISETGFIDKKISHVGNERN